MPRHAAARDARPKVAVIYHFFAHYRTAVIEAMARSPHAAYDFYGDTHDYEGSIEGARLGPDVRFFRRSCRQWRGPVMWQRGLLALAMGSRHDVLVFLGNPNWPATWLAALLGRLRGKRILYWTHGWIGPEPAPRRLVRRVFNSLAHAMLLYGHYGKVRGVRAGWAPQRLHVIYNSLDVAAQRRAMNALPPDNTVQVRTRLFGDASRPMVICSTRLVAARRLDLLVEALGIVRREGIESTLALIGDGPEQESLRRQAEEARVPTAFLGALYDESAIAPIMCAANVLVTPGRIGLTAMHALNYGVPIVSHDVADDQAPEWETIISGVTGDVFRRGDADDLARVLRPYLATVIPSESRRAACRRLIERFYNPWFQRAAIDRAVCGAEADDLFWLREGMPHEDRES